MSSGNAVAQYAYPMNTSAQGRGTSALVAINDHEFYVLERNNRGVGVGATVASPDKAVYRIDIAGAMDVSNVDLDAQLPCAQTSCFVTKSTTKVIDLDANTLAELGFKSPEKWEGLAIGPKLNNGKYMILAGTDNDYSVTQNANGTQFDVYFDFTLADPYAASIQCPLNQTTGCFATSNNSAAVLTSNFKMVPGVLHSYSISELELGNYAAPVPLPPSLALMLSGLFGLFVAKRLRKTAA